MGGRAAGAGRADGGGRAGDELQPPCAQAVFLELEKPRPSLKLLYVTPEQLVKGNRLKATLG